MRRNFYVRFPPCLRVALAALSLCVVWPSAGANLSGWNSAGIARDCVVPLAESARSSHSTAVTEREQAGLRFARCAWSHVGAVGQRLFDRPSTTYATVKRADADTDVARPLRDGHCLSFECYAMVRACVVCLLVTSGPSAILGGVRASSVRAVNGMVLRWSRTHVAQEYHEIGAPCGADGNSALSVEAIGAIRSVVATTDDASPDRVLGGVGLPVFVSGVVSARLLPGHRHLLQRCHVLGSGRVRSASCPASILLSLNASKRLNARALNGETA